MLQGPATERPAVRTLMEAVRAYRPVSVKLTNYDKLGQSYEHQLSVEPLRDPSGATLCFQARESRSIARLRKRHVCTASSAYSRRVRM